MVSAHDPTTSSLSSRFEWKLEEQPKLAREVERLKHLFSYGERCSGLDDGLVSRDRRAIREKIETEPKIRKWFQDLVKLCT